MAYEGDAEVDTDDREFEAAFAQIANGTPADAREAADPGDEAEKDPAEADASAEAPGAEAPEQAKDIWEGASPELIAWREQQEAELQRVRHSDQSQRGRIAALQRKLEGSSPPLQPRADQPEGDGAAVVNDKFKQLLEDYPEVAGPLVEEMQSLREELRGVKSVADTVSEERNAEQISRDVALLTERHPDAPTIAASDDYKGWLSEQSDDIQKMAESFDIRNASAVLTMFKAERGASTPSPTPTPTPAPTADARRSKQLDGSRAVTSKAPAASSTVPDDFEGAFAAEERKRAAAAKPR